MLATIIEKERPDAILPTMGCQTALNTALKLHEMGVLKKYNVELIGAKPDAIENKNNETNVLKNDNETIVLKNEAVVDSIVDSDNNLVSDADVSFDAVSLLNTNIDTSINIDVSNNELESHNTANSVDNLDVNENAFEINDEEIVLNQNFSQLNVTSDSNNGKIDEVVEVEPRRASKSLRKYSILALSRIEELTAEVNVNNDDNDDNDSSDNDSIHWDDDGNI